MQANQSAISGFNLETPRLIRLNCMTAAYVYSMSAIPEEEALNKITAYAKTNNQTGKNNRLFGRNTYPTDKPEPHGYEYYLTTPYAIQAQGQVTTKEIPAGLYAVYEVNNVCNLVEGWQKLFQWIEKNGYKSVGVTRGEHGWVNSAFEELVNWQENKAPVEWIFHLWVQLKE